MYVYWLIKSTLSWLNLHWTCTYKYMYRLTQPCCGWIAIKHIYIYIYIDCLNHTCFIYSIYECLKSSIFEGPPVPVLTLTALNPELGIGQALQRGVHGKAMGLGASGRRRGWSHGVNINRFIVISIIIMKYNSIDYPWLW